MKKNKKIIILISSILIFVLLTTIGILNRETIIQRFSNIMLQSDENDEEQELLSYKVYDNTDVNNLKMVFTVQTEDGIEYIKTPNNNQIIGYGKQKIAIDYVSQINAELNFKIKEINKPEVEESITITPEFGSEEYPFLIRTAKQLKNIANHFLEQKEILKTSSIYYKISKDIDLSGVEWTPIGGDSASTAFGGYLDGNNFKISNLNIEGTNNYQGLFGYLTGQVYNLNIENANVSGTNYVGALAGYSTNITKDCTVSNTEISATGENVGGLIGYSTGAINNNTVSVSITSQAKNVGGIVGNTTNVVNNNKASGTIVGNNNVGGVIGYTNLNISGNQFSGDVTGTTNVGGVCGYMYNYYTSLKAEKCCASGNIQGETNIGGVFGNVYIMNSAVGNSQNSIRTYITSCYFDGTCNASTKYGGGIIGFADVRGTRGTFSGTAYGAKLQLDQSFCLGSVNSNNYSGGLIGACNMSATHGSYQNTPHNYLYIEKSYVASEILGDDNTQAIVNVIYAAGRW